MRQRNVPIVSPVEEKPLELTRKLPEAPTALKKAKKKKAVVKVFNEGPVFYCDHGKKCKCCGGPPPASPKDVYGCWQWRRSDGTVTGGW